MMDKIEYSINRKNKNSKGYLKTIIFIVLAFALGMAIMYFFSLNNPNIKIITKERNISEVKVSEEAIEDAIAKIYDAVLCLQVLDQNGNVISSGTGFVYDKEGYILTNAHVVASGYSIQGTLSNNEVVNLSLLGSDTYADLAVLKMDKAKVIQIASIGISENTKIGNTVFTVGSPMGVEYAGTVTKGIISAKDRLIETSTSSYYSSESYIVKVLQTDAAISPGNSGGPLVNLAGDVIGINSLKLVDSTVEGMGFAIPIEDAMSYVDYLEQGKKIQRPMFGVQILDLSNKNYLSRYGININTKLNKGIVVVSTTNGYPADKAGIQKGDIITKINNQNISSVTEFKYQLYKCKVGDTVNVTYYRNDKEYNVKVKLDKANE